MTISETRPVARTRRNNFSDGFDFIVDWYDDGKFHARHYNGFVRRP